MSKHTMMLTGLRTQMTGRSTSGTTIFLGPNLMSWWSKKHKVISRSNTKKKEYRIFALALAEVTWIQILLSELQVRHTTPVWFFYDNMRTVALAHNPILHSKTKHMELDLFFVREKIMEKSLV